MKDADATRRATAEEATVTHAGAEASGANQTGRPARDGDGARVPARRAVKPARGGRGGKGPKCAEADADPDQLWDDLARTILDL